MAKTMGIALRVHSTERALLEAVAESEGVSMSELVRGIVIPAATQRAQGNVLEMALQKIRDGRASGVPA